MHRQTHYNLKYTYIIHQGRIVKIGKELQSEILTRRECSKNCIYNLKDASTQSES